MKMSISNREKKLLLMLGGILFMVASYFFVYTPQMEEATLLENQNTQLESRLNELLEMKEHKQFYLDETAAMQVKVEEYCRIFPADIREEDGIVLAKNMEFALPMEIDSVGLGAKSMIATMDAVSDTTTSTDEGTLMEQANAQTKDAVAEIEGETVEEKQPQQVTYYSPTLYCTQDTLSFACSYETLKDTVEYLNSQTGRLTLDSVNASYDSGSGVLRGSMVVNLYSMTGTDAIYSEPDAGMVPYGKSNPFGTIESNAGGVSEDSEEGE